MRECSSGEIASAFGRKEHLVDANRSHAHDDTAQDSWQCSTVSPDLMPIGIRWFAQYQSFTPVIDTLQGLLLGTLMGNSAILAVAWCVVLALVDYLWARAVYNRNSPR